VVDVTATQRRIVASELGRDVAELDPEERRDVFVVQ
jgi:hypothetical protein